MQVSRKQNLAPDIYKYAQQSMLRSKHEQQPLKLTDCGTSSESFSAGDETACFSDSMWNAARLTRITRKRETSENEAIVFGVRRHSTTKRK